MNPIRIWILLLQIWVCLPLVISENGLDNTTVDATAAADLNITCPDYRWLDVEHPTTPIYGAPDGCRCWDGLEEINCGYCLNDLPCQEHTQSHICREGFEFNSKDTYKSYKCRTKSSFDAVFPYGKGSFYFDLEGGVINVSIFNTRTVNSYHLMDCTLSGCDFEVGGTNTKCKVNDCSCTKSGQCARWFESMVSGFTGQPAEIIVEESVKVAADDAFLSEAFGNADTRAVSFVVEDGSYSIDLLCSASACTEADPILDEAVFEFQPLEDSAADETKDDQTKKKNNGSTLEGDAWKDSGKLSLLILCIVFALFVLVGSFALVPFLCGGRPWNGITEAAASEQMTLTPGVGDSDKHVLEFFHLSKTVQLRGKAAKAYGKDKKVIISNISGRVESGNVLGIMGPSGGGKSTLLNTLAAVETSGGSTISGQILLNGNERMQGYRKAVAYVYQHDALYDTLTVQECIEYSALLRLPIEWETNKKQALAWKTMEELNLVDIAHNQIGSSGHASVSGGERRRVAIGMELVAMPKVMFLDEPTSGLDSSAANNILSILSELASGNRIVVLSIHQPSIRSFMLMDQILVLGSGRVMYDGKPGDARNYLEGSGFACPEDLTVPDFMLDVVSNEDNQEVLKGPETTQSEYDSLRISTRGKHSTTEEGSGQQFDTDLPNVSGVQNTSILNEIITLFSRTSKNTFRNSELFLMQLIISVLLAFFAGGIFNDVSLDLAGFQNRLGAFYFSLSFFGFASFSSMDIFISERYIFERETGAKMYTAFAYFVAKTSLDLFFLRVIPVTIFSVVFYWLMGLDNAFEKFLVFWATMVLFNLCAGIISISISIAAPTVGQANLLAVVWFLIMLLFGGFLVNIESMAAWYSWLRFLSIYYYAFELLVTNELTGLLFSFDAPGFPRLPVRGEVFVETIAMDVDNQTRNLICLCGLAAWFSLLAYLLMMLRVPRSAASFFKRMQKENERLATTGSPERSDHQGVLTAADC
ncbi:Putative white-brown complex homolog protein 30 [Seminavis robusta]|uniref:White-brown complex homolog protein 30 n=1 Tax=Seminavis robusta TaxID=568900 RepID=A0A9N8DTS0_9STRA|nr:Putative white-brown complex homolog protein 30 [Seminavis robusta]|eukprot:Sro244_g097150.1 Putative white-brown complex homolog protein 30 (986) ;mRNA; r:27570-30619